MKPFSIVSMKRDLEHTLISSTRNRNVEMYLSV